MPASVKMMPGFVMDQFLHHPSESAESVVIRTENTPENRQAADQARRQEKQNLRITALLNHEYTNLKPCDRALLVAFWRDCCKYPRDLVVQKLHFKNDDAIRSNNDEIRKKRIKAIRVDKWRALKTYPCGSTRGVCDQVPNCAHSRGKEVSNEIIRRVANKLRSEHD